MTDHVRGIERPTPPLQGTQRRRALLLALAAGVFAAALALSLVGLIASLP